MVGSSKQLLLRKQHPKMRQLQTKNPALEVQLVQKVGTEQKLNWKLRRRM